MTRGERNNNPGNVRHVHGVTWEGQSQSQMDDAFVQFDDPVYGIRAIVRIMRSYQKEGLSTIQGIINRWAPPNENNSQAYVAAVCSYCGVTQYDPVDFNTLMPMLVKAIIQHENGEMVYSDDQISKGISLA
jgi:hypothetical protein